MPCKLPGAAAWSLIGAAVLGACGANSPTGPSAATHPAGHGVSSIFLPYAPFGVAISSLGLAYITQSTTDSVATIDLAGPTVRATFAVGSLPHDIAFNASGNTAYVTNVDDGSVGVINTATGVQTKSYPLASWPLRILVGPGASVLYVTLGNGGLAVLNASTGALLATIAIGGTPNGLALDPGAGRLYVSSTAGTVTVISTATNAPIDTIMIGGFPQDVAILPGRNALYVANEQGWVDVRDLATGARTDSIPVEGAFGAAVTPDGAEVWVAQSGVGRVAIIDAATAEVIDSAWTFGTPRHIAFTPLGDAALVTNEGGYAQVIR
jgi:YVTN family beta-propeller protein